MTDDQLLLANAYVDDDLDAAERARAEADDEVMAEVARLRATVAALRDVEPPDPARRAAALAAAMRERPTPVAPPIPLRPRRTWAAAGIAAALVAVVIGGAVVLQATSGGGDDDSSSIQLSADQPPSAADQSEAAATTAPAATAAGASATTQAGAGTEADSEATAAGGAGTPTTTVPARSAAPVAPAGEALTVLASPDDLIAFAMEATPQTPPPSACTGGRYVAPASYAGVTPAVTVEVFVDGADAVARDAASCVEVVRVPLP